jgi:hypothetical protein
MRTYASGLVLIFVAIAAARGTTLHVSSTGNDGNSGTEVKPFATLARVRDEIRQRSDHRPIDIIVHGGTYRQPATLELDARDSNTHWQAATGEEVRINGGIRLDAKAFAPVNDQAILRRLSAAARGHVLTTDLSWLGVRQIDGWPDKFRGAPAAPELIFNDQRMHIARWPNQTWAEIGKIIDPGSAPRDGDMSNRLPVFICADPRPQGWNANPGVWLCGNWTYNWYDEVIRVKSIDAKTGQITLASPATYSVKSGRFYALNLLEELDMPGEYYIDASSRQLYFWPPAPVEQARIVLSTLNAPLLSINKADNVTFSGMVFEDSLGDGIHVSDGSGVRIERCKVRNVRQSGIVVNGGSNDVVDTCEIYDTGTGGLYLAGGDRRTLTPAHHAAVNNRIHHFSRLQLTGAYAITLAGVGNRAAHNLIHDAPHQAVLIAGNDNVVEYNIIRNAVTDAEDAGALYKGRDPSCRGNLIRFNFFRDIGNPHGHNCAIYFDDGDGGDSVVGNIFLRCGGIDSFGAVFSHGGFDIRAENNIFIDCTRALGSNPWDYARWKDALNGGQDCHWPTKLLKDVDITSDVFTRHYPQLIGFMDPQPAAPRQSHARNNVLVRCGAIADGNWKCDAATTWSTSSDPGFIDAEREDFRQNPDGELFRHLPGFEPIPFTRIGPQAGNNDH